jgi:hypothetical protein
VEAEVVLRLGTAVDPQDARIAAARLELRRLDYEGLDLGAVRAGKLDLLHLAEPQ